MLMEIINKDSVITQKNMKDIVNRNQLLQFLHSIDEGFMLLDSSWNIIDLNIHAWQKMGFTIESDCIGDNFLDVFPSARRTERLKKYKEVFETGKSAYLEDECIIDYLGSRFFNIHIYRVADGLGIIFNDVTEEKQKELELISNNKKLMDVNKQLHRSREEERATIAREIHDELGQSLTAMKYELHWLMRHRSDDNQAQLEEKNIGLIDTADEIIQVVKNITSKLRLEFLETHSLSDALKLKVKQFNMTTGIEASILIEDEQKEIDRDASIIFYRIFQEALTNIARHSGASKVETTLTYEKGKAIMCIKDNGRGIKIEELEDPGAYGLIGMRERCGYINGELNICGEPGVGTVIKTVIPVV